MDLRSAAVLVDRRPHGRQGRLPERTMLMCAAQGAAPAEESMLVLRTVGLVYFLSISQIV